MLSARAIPTAPSIVVTPTPDCATRVAPSSEPDTDSYMPRKMRRPGSIGETAGMTSTSAGAPRRSASSRAQNPTAVAAIAVVLVVGLVRDDDGSSSPAPAASSAATAPAGPDVPVALTDWLRSELPAGGTVAADPESDLSQLYRDIARRAAAGLAYGTPDDAFPSIEITED